MEETENTNSKQRTSKEQIEHYLNFVRDHPEIKLHKNDPTCPKRIDSLWSDLAAQLNALKDATRSAAKWKETLAHWKNQIRSWARKSKAHMMATGGGPCAQMELSPVEQRALDTLGTLVVGGADDVPNIGIENEIDSSNSVAVSASSSTPKQSRIRKTTSDEMFHKMMELSNERQEEEEKFRNDSLECFNSWAQSLNNMASAIVTLSEAISKSLNK